MSLLSPPLLAPLSACICMPELYSEVMIGLRWMKMKEASVGILQLAGGPSLV